MVVPDRYDFRTVLIHELVHALGFLEAGRRRHRPEHQLDALRQLPARARRQAVIDEALQIKPHSTCPTSPAAPTAAVLHGPQAMAAFGGPVPLFTPDPWATASSPFGVLRQRAAGLPDDAVLRLRVGDPQPQPGRAGDAARPGLRGQSGRRIRPLPASERPEDVELQGDFDAVLLDDNLWMNRTSGCRVLPKCGQQEVVSALDL